ncbi:hypothetical protein FF1_034626 [Malus domestica]
MSAAVGAISATKGDDGHSDEVDLDEEDDEVAALESEKDQPSLSSSLPLFRIFNLKKHREGVKVKKTKIIVVGGSPFPEAINVASDDSTVSEIVLVIQAYRTLRDHGSYPADQIVKDLEGSFAFVVYDSKGGNVFAALGSDGGEQLYWGIAADGSVVIYEEL